MPFRETSCSAVFFLGASLSFLPDGWLTFVGQYRKIDLVFCMESTAVPQRMEVTLFGNTSLDVAHFTINPPHRHGPTRPA
ncbi:MAG: hypothetical protein KDC31_09230 [Saprospiraceae bacterium]|nr:hypothetical protein [Saprospiraceae bacterium]MBX7179000.1 hypothetical protein [Saprospiraceae bacterium]MCB0591462.1 hypothetical protein [Saprospiraceae bacterium]MCO5282237.1 hypothetical protein [Saprospiraceae bacterium]MCO6470890.1 hypothetical protein [Saprospiraceae bacterium]